MPEVYEWLCVARSTTVPLRGRAIASQELRANHGFFRLKLAPYSLRKPTLRSCDRFGQHARGLRPPSSGGVLLHRGTYNPCYRGWRLSGRLLQAPSLLYTCEHPGKGTLNATQGGLHKRSHPGG